MSFKDPPGWQVKKLLRQKCKLIKVTENEIEDEYNQSIESQTELKIKNCEIQPITSEDLKFMPPGVLQAGDARAFFSILFSDTFCMHEFVNPPIYDYDPDKIEMANGLVQLLRKGTGLSPVYDCGNPWVEPKFSCKFEATPHHIIFKEYKPEKTEVKYLLSKDAGNTWYYWDGSNWVVSDGTYSQSSTSKQIEDNFTTFPSSPGLFTWKIFLHSDDGTKTPQVELIKAIFGWEVEINDYIVDQQNIKYRVERVTNYYTKDNILLKECYLKRVAGE